MEHGDDSYPADFPGIEVLSSVLDKMLFYDEDDEDKHHHNDVNVGEAFYLSSALHGGATAGDILRENDNKRGSLPYCPLQPQPGRNLPEKVTIPSMVANLQAEMTSSRSEVFPETCFNGSISSSEADLIRLQVGQSWARPSSMQQYSGGNAVRSEGFLWKGTGSENGVFHRVGGIVSRSPVGVLPNMNSADCDDSGGGDAIATLFVGELQWWTTDADLEAEFCKYGPVKGVKFFEEKSNGKSKGCAQVEFYDLVSAKSCQEGMNGHIFNGRSCVVVISSPQGVKKLGEAQVSRNQQELVKGPSRFVIMQMRGGRAHIAGDSGGEVGGGGGWGISEMGNIGHKGNSRDFGPMRRVGGNGGTTGYEMPMSRTSAGYGGFPLWPARRAFRGIPVVTSHSNPAFIRRGMPTGGVGKWAEPSMVGWGAEEQSSYGNPAASHRCYNEESHGKYEGAD